MYLLILMGFTLDFVMKCSVSLVMLRLELSDLLLRGNLFVLIFMPLFTLSPQPGCPHSSTISISVKNPFIGPILRGLVPTLNPKPTPSPLSSHSHVLVSLHTVCFAFYFFISYGMLYFLKDCDLCHSDFYLSLIK